MVNPLIPWLAFSPDGIVLDEQYIVEIKCPVAGKTKAAINMISDCKFLSKDKNGNICLREKHMYYFQVQIGMFICAVKKCDFVVYSSFDDTCIVIPIMYDESIVCDYISRLMYVYFIHFLPALVDDDKENNE